MTPSHSRQRIDVCFVCGGQAVAASSALNPGGPVCYTHSWGMTEEEAEARFFGAVLEIAGSIERNPVKYTRRVDEFEAVQWSGSNWHEMLAFAGKENVTTDGKNLFLRISETGSYTVPPEWWVLRVNDTTYSVCDPVVFAQNYEPVPIEELPE